MLLLCLIWAFMVNGAIPGVLLVEIVFRSFAYFSLTRRFIEIREEIIHFISPFTHIPFPFV